MPKLPIEYYLLSVTEPKNAKFKIKYKNGIFHSFTRQSGKIVSANAWQFVLNIIPYQETLIQQKQLSLPPQITLQPIHRTEPETIFKQFLDIYVHFHESEYEIPPKINITQTKALKETIKYIENITKSVDEAVAVWSIIFEHWKYLDDFFQKQTKLSQINQYISQILIQLKQFTQSGR